MPGWSKGLKETQLDVELRFILYLWCMWIKVSFSQFLFQIIFNISYWLLGLFAFSLYGETQSSSSFGVRLTGELLLHWLRGFSCPISSGEEPKNKLFRTKIPKEKKELWKLLEWHHSDNTSGTLYHTSFHDVKTPSQMDVAPWCYKWTHVWISFLRAVLWWQEWNN